MRVNLEAIEELVKSKNLSHVKLAKKLGINNSYLFRLFRQQRTGYSKLLGGLYKTCKR